VEVEVFFMRFPTTIRAVLVPLCLATLVTAAPAETPAAASAVPLRISGVAVSLAGMGRSGMTPVDIVIERWSTGPEQEKLREALIEKGSDALMNTLTGMKPRAGYIRTPTSLGWDIQFARETVLPTGGRRIVFGTDRPMSFEERASNSRSSDYDFLVGEIHITPDGKGTGKVFPAARLSWNRDTHSVDVENWDTQPVRLQDLHIGK
jgi:hypothetical protein